MCCRQQDPSSFQPYQISPDFADKSSTTGDGTVIRRRLGYAAQDVGNLYTTMSLRLELKI